MSSDDQHRRTARPTIRDVARTAGVSTATVSRVLNGRPDVAAATRERVLGAVRELDYSTNRSARSLAGGRTFLVGITLPLVEVEYFSRIVAGAADELYDHDLQVVLAPTLHLRDRAATLLARLAGGVTDGALLILPEESGDELLALARSGYPLLAPRSPISPSVPAPLPASHSSKGGLKDRGTPSPSRESAPMARGIGRGTRQGLIVPFSLGVLGPY